MHIVIIRSKIITIQKGGECRVQKKCTHGRRNRKCVTDVCVLVGDRSTYYMMWHEGGRGGGGEWDRNSKLQVCVIPFEYILISAFFHHSAKHHLTGGHKTKQDNLQPLCESGLHRRRGHHPL